MRINSICVYCGSSPGSSAEYLAAARTLGDEIANRGIHLVYGGASVGLMGAVAQAALNSGGKVTGVIPQSLADQEVAFTALDNLIVVNSMHERKAKMAELADGFIAMPGGYGTLDEFFEVLTWAQLGLHAKPCGLLNVSRYFDALLSFLDHSVEEMFIYEPHREMILSADKPGELLDQIAVFEMKPVRKSDWIHAVKNQQKST